MDEKQAVLLRIVRSWDINHRPEYRGFRCANCQKYMHKAWHYWCINKDYKTPVHFCNKCKADFEALKIDVSNSKRLISRKEFELKSVDLEKELKAVVGRWNLRAEPAYKSFACDSCAKKMRRAHHFWFKFKDDDRLLEAHFCRSCAATLFR